MTEGSTTASTSSLCIHTGLAGVEESEQVQMAWYPTHRTVFAPQTWATPMESLERWHDTVHLMIMVRTKIYPTMNLADVRIKAGARDPDIEETTIR